MLRNIAVILPMRLTRSPKEVLQAAEAVRQVRGGVESDSAQPPFTSLYNAIAYIIRHCLETEDDIKDYGVIIEPEESWPLLDNLGENNGD